MKKLIIGVTGTSDFKFSTRWLRHYYFRAIKSLGAVAIDIAVNSDENKLKEAVEQCDGFIFSGGADIDPSRYNCERNKKCEAIDLARDKMEFKLLELVLQAKKPVLGVCRGCQLINVFQGGTLYQDINDCSMINTVNHRQNGLAYGFVHKVALLNDSFLANELKARLLEVNSLHHQGINKLGHDLTINAVAPDGIIEAVSLNSYPFCVAVQWHPELLQAYSAQKQIFKSFLSYCDKSNQQP